MTGDGFPTAAEIRRLEKEADELLREDARRQGSKTGNRRGFSAYAKKYGLSMSTHTKHEKTGFSEQQLESLATDPNSMWQPIVHEVEEEA